jgi:hypothetical protein
MRVAILIVPTRGGGLPSSTDLERAGFALSEAVAREEAGPPGTPGAGNADAQASGPEGAPDEPGRKARESKEDYSTSSKPSTASSTVIPS